MSSHREAPEIAKDPVADSTDLYAFVSPDAPDTVTIIANYIPLQPPASGPRSAVVQPKMSSAPHGLNWRASCRPQRWARWRLQSLMRSISP